MNQPFESPLKGKKLASNLEFLANEWQIEKEHHLEKAFHFKNFKEALEFTNRVGEIAEIEKHHPDIYLSYGIVKIKIWTHKIEGLTEKDFNLAKKIDLIKI
jgi:4a-hydroxytetrahydrobiopterin dehydratase